MDELEKQINLKLSEYVSSFSDNDNKFYRKDFKNNCKFINSSVNRMLKRKEPKQEILKFINDCIKYHKESYGLLLLTQDEYFKTINYNALHK